MTALLDLFHKLLDDITSITHKVIFKLSEQQKVEFLTDPLTGCVMELQFDTDKKPLYKPLQEDDQEVEKKKAFNPKSRDHDLATLMTALPAPFVKAIKNQISFFPASVIEFVLDVVTSEPIINKVKPMKLKIPKKISRKFLWNFNFIGFTITSCFH